MELLVFLKSLHDDFIELSKNIKFDKTHPRQLHLIGLYGSIVELSGGIITLIDKKIRTGVPPLFRSILETHVELKNLYSEAEYGYYMQASYHDQWLKVLKEAKNSPNPFLGDITNSDILEPQLLEHQSELDSLKSKGYSPLNIYQRFEKAGMINEYRSLYNFLANESHSNIRALISRHYEINDDDFTVVYYKDEPIEDFLIYIDSTAGILVDASGMIHEIFETGFEKKVNELRENLGELRKKSFNV